MSDNRVTAEIHCDEGDDVGVVSRPPREESDWHSVNFWFGQPGNSDRLGIQIYTPSIVMCQRIAGVFAEHALALMKYEADKLPPMPEGEPEEDGPA